MAPGDWGPRARGMHQMGHFHLGLMIQAARCTCNLAGS